MISTPSLLCKYAIKQLGIVASWVELLRPSCSVDTRHFDTNRPTSRTPLHDKRSMSGLIIRAMILEVELTIHQPAFMRPTVLTCQVRHLLSQAIAKAFAA